MKFINDENNSQTVEMNNNNGNTQSKPYFQTKKDLTKGVWEVINSQQPKIITGRDKQLLKGLFPKEEDFVLTAEREMPGEDWNPSLLSKDSKFSYLNSQLEHTVNLINYTNKLGFF